MSLKRAVKSLQQIPYIHLCQSAQHTLGVYTGGNTIYLMLHCPHVQSPPPHAGDSVFNFHFIFWTGRRVQGNGLHLAVNHHLNTELNVIWEESTRGPRITPLKIFVFIYSGMCNWFLLFSPNDVCKRWTEKSHTSFFPLLLLPLFLVF